MLRHSVKQMEQMQGANVGVDGAVHADRACATAASAQAGINVGGRRCSRSSAATTRPRPTPPASTSWCARASTRTACPRCSRSCSPNARARPRRVEHVVHRPPARGRSRSRRRADQIAQINPAIIRTLTNELARVQRLQGSRARAACAGRPARSAAGVASGKPLDDTGHEAARTRSAARAVVSSTSACVIGVDRQSACRDS